MTRGQMAIITKGGILTSVEFNGDMYLDHNGYGEDAIESLRNSTDVATYQYEVAKFNVEHHHYDDDRLVYTKDKSALDFTKDYFDVWFSDYVYIKNLTKEDYELLTEKRDHEGRKIGVKKVNLAPNEIAVLCFGRLVKITN